MDYYADINYSDLEIGSEASIAWERALTEGDGFHYRINGGYEAAVGRSGGIEGREMILFIGPTADTSVESWLLFSAWDVQRGEGGTIVAVYPFRHYYSPEEVTQFQSELEIELPAFRTAILAAQQARVVANDGRTQPDPSFPMLITDANNLRQYYVHAGAYSDPDGPPAQPPPAQVCTNGIAVDPITNRGLVHDCEALLAAKDTLRGTATLNWSKDLAIGSWDGITMSGTPSRVTEVDLSSESLSGTIAAELGRLIKLTDLDLSSNALTGSIPAELGLLINLEEVRLSGNSLTGCIPVALKDVATNDLNSLNLRYCAPPAPGNLRVGTTTQTSVPLSWDAVANTSRYRMEYRRSLTRDWTTDTETLTTTSHTVNELLCYKGYQFRVSAYGSGTTYAAAWSEPSTILSEITGECVSPVFDEESYSFTVMEDAGTGAAVGTVLATDPNDDALTYRITGGNAERTFAIGPSTGTITVAGPLNRTTMPLHTLTVEADDGNGNTDTVTVALLSRGAIMG